MPKYERILLKVSGEALAGGGKLGIDSERIHSLATEIAEVVRAGVQLGLVVGGGNFFRGVSEAAKSMDRVTADHMGMLATVINALALQGSLERLEIPTRVMTAIEMNAVAEPYIRRKALRHFEKGRTVIFAGGTSNPFLFHRHRGYAARARNQGPGGRQSYPGGRRLRPGSGEGSKGDPVPRDLLSRVPH